MSPKTDQLAECKVVKEQSNFELRFMTATLCQDRNKIFV